MGPEIVVPTAFLLAIVGIVWLVTLGGQKKMAEVSQTLRAAIEKGQELTPEAMAAMTRLIHPRRDLRLGIVFIALALAFGALAGLLSSESPEAVRPILGVGIFPLFLGLAFLGLHFFANDSNRK